jgi:MFS transporter, ACS family, hexuronate transporter
MYPTSSGRYQWIVLTLVSVALFLPSLVLFSIGALAPALRDSLSLSRQEIGFLAAIFSLSAAFFAIPSGWVADRLKIRTLLAAVQAIGGMALAVVPVLHGYYEFCAIMFLSGMTYTAILVMTSKAIADWFSFGRRAMAMGIRGMALSAAGAVAGVALPPLAIAIGWRPSYALIGCLMLLSAGGNLLFYRNRLPQANAVVMASSGAGSVWRNADLWRLAFAGFCFGGVQFSFTTYLILFLHERWGFSGIVAGSFLAQAQLAAILSRVPYGWIVDRWFGGHCKPLFSAISVAGLLALLALLLVEFSGASVVVGAIVIIFGLSGLSFMALYQTLAVEIGGRRFAGRSSGIAATCLQMGNVVLAPIFGALADLTRSYSASWVLLILAQFLGIVLLSSVRSSRTVSTAVEEPAPAAFAADRDG